MRASLSFLLSVGGCASTRVNSGCFEEDAFGRLIDEWAAISPSAVPRFSLEAFATTEGAGGHFLTCKCCNYVVPIAHVA